jgi:hypothetical protein
MRSRDTRRRVSVNAGAARTAPAGEAAHDWRRENIGRLLLFAFAAFESKMIAGYRAAGFDDVRQVHLNALRHVDVRTGTRIVDLAARAGVTKGAMGQMLEECARLDLVVIARSSCSSRSAARSSCSRPSAPSRGLNGIFKKCSAPPPTNSSCRRCGDSTNGSRLRNTYTFQSVAALSSNWLDPLRARRRGLERVGKILGLAGDLAIRKLHDAHRIGRLAVIL